MMMMMMMMMVMMMPVCAELRWLRGGFKRGAPTARSA